MREEPAKSRGVPPSQGSGAQSSRGFLMSLEAAFSLALLIIAVSALPAFHPQKNPAPGFFLCSDAALALAKDGAFSDPSGMKLRGKVRQMERLSGMCIEAEALLAHAASSCAFVPREKTILSLPVHQDGLLLQARVSCWPPE